MKRTSGVIVVAAALAVGFGVGSCVTWRSLSPKTEQAATPRPSSYTCPMHPAYMSDRPGDCPSCGMRLVPVVTGDAAPFRANAFRVQPGTQQVAGIVVGQVERRPLQRVLRNTGRVVADETRIYRINTSAGGWIRRTFQNSVGSLVRKDEPLATFYTREFQTAQQSYFYALDALDRFTAANASESQLAATRAQVQSAIDTLEGLGMTSIQIQGLARTRKLTLEIELRSPITGFIIARNVSPGQRYSAGDELYRVVDLSRVWVLADIYEYQRRFMLPGQHVTVLSDGEQYPARTSSVLPTFDSSTRTLKLRLEMDNPGYRFRPDMFVDVDIPVNLPEALTVPADAVVNTGTRKVVFVDRGNGYFEARSVETGWQMGDRVEIVKGLMPGERIVISGNFLLDSESRMKAATTSVSTSEVDPVCGMVVDRDGATAAKRLVSHGGRDYYFCSDDCRRRFAEHPDTFLAR